MKTSKFNNHFLNVNHSYFKQGFFFNFQGIECLIFKIISIYDPYIVCSSFEESCLDFSKRLSNFANTKLKNDCKTEARVVQ